MRTLRGVLIALFVLSIFGLLSPNARADEWNKKTTVAFCEPVEIPGHVLLPGEYVFNLANSIGVSDRPPRLSSPLKSGAPRTGLRNWSGRSNSAKNCISKRPFIG